MEARPVPVSRDTRRLITIIGVAIALLWILARIRFPDRPSAPAPVPAVLAPLAPPPALDDIVASLRRLTPRVEPFVAVVVTRDGSDLRREEQRPALRVSGDLAVLVLEASTAIATPPEGALADVVARDPASNLVVVRLRSSAIAEAEPWLPMRPEAPRVLIAANAANGRPSLRPLFVASLHETSSPFWAGSIWVLAADASAPRGSLLFTTDGAPAGIVAPHGGGVAIVPVESLRGAARQLMARDGRPPGRIGVEIRPLTVRLASALGAADGVLVTWVDPYGPAADVLTIADVIERLEGSPITDVDQWHARMARLQVDDVVTVSVRRGGDVWDASVVAGSVPAPVQALGLSLRRVPRVGAQILTVTPGSAAARANLRAGDTITRFADRNAPTPSAIARLFADAPGGGPLLVAVTRGDRHEVVVLEKP